MRSLSLVFSDSRAETKGCKLKSWTLRELKNVVTALKPLVSLRLQEIQTSPQDVVLGFYSPSGMLWLWLDLNAISPCLLPWGRELPLRPHARKTPLRLFLRAHFVNRVLREIYLREDLGRVVVLNFDDGTELEVHLFPHRRNLLARTEGKSIAWQKPEELIAAPEPIERAMRTLDELREEWLAQKAHSKSVQKKMPDANKARVEKKQNALLKVEQELMRKRELPWREVGNWLKAHQSLAVPKEWELYIDKRRNLAWNIEQAFTRARETDGKILGTEKRRSQLLAEIQNPTTPTAADVAKPKPSLAKMDAKGRTLRLKDDMTVVAGKSAADNLKILRKARGWDLWFHLRDFPSRHAVLFRNKNTTVGDAQLQEVAAWFVRLCLGQKFSAHSGEKIALVIAECRHVHPIKGDKIGRVTYHEGRTLSYKIPT